MLKSLEDLEFFDTDEWLGEGAYSKVIRVLHKGLNKEFALKTMDVFKVSKLDCENLRNEIKLHKTLDHPHIIKFYDCL